jgi:polyferredoxin
MTKIGKPRRLIRYASADGIARQAGFLWTAKIIVYIALFVVLAGALATLLANRTEIDITLLRTPGMFYQEQPDGRVANVYDVKILNKSFLPAAVRLTLHGRDGEVQVIGEDLTVLPQQIREAKLLIVLDRASLSGLSTPLQIDAFQNGTQLQQLQTTFLGPGKQ